MIPDGIVLKVEINSTFFRTGPDHYVMYTYEPITCFEIDPIRSGPRIIIVSGF